MKKSPSLTASLATKLILGLFALMAIHAPAEEDAEDRAERYEAALRPFACSTSADGKILYEREGRLGNHPAQLSIAGHHSKLTVAGTTNRVERIHVYKGASGRTVVTMLFKNPPAVGDSSVLFVGSAMKDATKTYYFGDVYETARTLSDICECEDWHLPAQPHWKHKGGFNFSAFR